MRQIVWIILQKNDQYLLSQKSFCNIKNAMWCFPSGQKRLQDNIIQVVQSILTTNLNTQAERIRKLFNTEIGQCNVQVFLCDKWSSDPEPANKDVVQLQWFTLSEIYSLEENLSPPVSEILLHLSYLIQHYEHHPNEWIEQWRECGKNV